MLLIELSVEINWIECWNLLPPKQGKFVMQFDCQIDQIEQNLLPPIVHSIAVVDERQQKYLHLRLMSKKNEKKRWKRKKIPGNVNVKITQI